MKYIYKLVIILIILSACTDERELDFLDNIGAPTDVKVAFNITQDNTGLVTIVPTAQGASSFTVSYGDESNEEVTLNSGETTSHTYKEGLYNVVVNAISLKGDETQITEELMVSFRAPENLEVEAEIDASNPFILNVSAEADFATSFLVYFDAENEDEEPTPLSFEEVVSFEYPSVGTNTIRVVALSGGAEMTEYEEVITIAKPTELPIDFEIFDESIFFGFGGASNAVVENPDTDGNESSKVVEIIKGGPEVWAGNVIVLSSPIDFSVRKVITMDVWSPRPGGKLILKVENLDDANINIEKEITTVGNGAWEKVTFDLSDIDTANTYQKLVFFFDFGLVGAGGSDWTFYIDNIEQALGDVGVITDVFEDFEGEAPIYTPFGGAVATVVPNPDASGINTTGTVTQFDKTNGAEVWAGAFFESDTAIDHLTYNTISIKSWSPKVGANVIFKMENSANSDDAFEMTVPTTVANEWEELVFDISDAPNFVYDKIVIFYDFGVVGDDSTFYFDEITLINNSGGGSSASLVINDLESGDTMFTSFGNANVVVASNPDMSGGNVSATVAQFDKPNGAEVWAGGFFDIETPVDIFNYSKITINSWSPKAGANVIFKMENSANSDEAYEMTVPTTVANEWEELVFDISGASDFTYDRIVIFYDFGVTGDGTTYYFDDITLTN